MWKYIGKIFINLIFVTVLYLVSYTNLDTNAAYQLQHLSQFFFNRHNLTRNFQEIISFDDYWEWLHTCFTPNIRAESWYNGDPVENMTDFLNDKTTRIIGWATMRQLRLKLDAYCKIPVITRPFISSCKGKYSIFNEDAYSYAPGWVSSTNVSYPTSIKNAFIYRTSAELDSYIYVGDHGTYGSGGYVYEFRGNLNELQENLTLLRQLSWLDEKSRAVMIQLNLYNPNVNFFTSVTLLTEIMETGEVFPSAYIEPMQMYTEFNDFSSIFYLIIASIYILFIIYFTICECYSIYKLKKKYFRQIRSYIEWGIIICSWTGVGVYIWRYDEANRIGNYFRYTNGTQYINLQFATYVNNLLTFLLGFCCFFGTVRLLQLFDIYPRINIFSRTLRRAFKDLVSFSIMYFLLFSAFAILFYLLFVSDMESCSTIILTSNMLFQMILLKFDTSDLLQADAFLGPFVFTLFIYFCVFIGYTMFIVIINIHFRFIRRETIRQELHSPNIPLFIIKDIAKRLGFRKGTITPLPQPISVVIHSKHKTPVEQLPDKFKKLIIAIDKIYPTHTESDITENNQITTMSNFNTQRKRRRKRHIIY
ncbi:unnamed protein product [Adineta steineri]|uniref:Uncharacterized protein n=1 Tax=Adineta steineri TaxID=433720 RepID=A0A814W3G5_9BILA|nr:unnamed protein product [Adineta steineri]CAF1196010.1 unnamed protein product [Adineta steineri]CAF3745228.1 unnamed protein product [Adineta steineri]CAF3748734.1 unnamed protein product [Adineta steineri]